MLARQRLDRRVHARLAHHFGRGNTRMALMRRAADRPGNSQCKVSCAVCSQRGPDNQRAADGDSRCRMSESGPQLL
jgi:hypothetical protein